MNAAVPRAFAHNFLGDAPPWYKRTILLCLLLNLFLVHTAGPFVAGWVLLVQFIFTLVMAHTCHPLPAGGLIAIQATALGLTGTGSIYRETVANFEIILLLIFLVAAVYFLRELLQLVFPRILVSVRSKLLLSLSFCLSGALLSAFLDALTVTTVIIAVTYGFYNVYHRFATGKDGFCPHDLKDDDACKNTVREELKAFRLFLCSLVMHGAVGTVLGGGCTLVGEPQNLLIGAGMGWDFAAYFLMNAPVTIPTIVTGVLTCALVEKRCLCGHGVGLPETIRIHLKETEATRSAAFTPADRVRLMSQLACALWLMACLALHLAAEGIVGLSGLVLLTACNGITDEHQLGKAFTEALPFAALLVVFFSMVAMVRDLQLFTPLLHRALDLEGAARTTAYYATTSLLSLITDNVFVTTAALAEITESFTKMLDAIPGLPMGGETLMTMLTDPTTARTHVLARFPAEAARTVGAIMVDFDRLAVAVAAGTTFPSVGTPNGQAALLFLLTSRLSQALQLSYVRMVILALPYTVTLSLCSLLAVGHLNVIATLLGG